MYIIGGLTLAGIKALLKGQKLHLLEHGKIRERLTIIETKLGIPVHQE